MQTVTVAVIPRDRFSLSAGMLETLLARTPESYELLFIDCSMPPSYRSAVEAVLAGHAHARMVASAEPLLSNAARNLAFHESRGEYLCLIENDVFVHDGWLDALVDACESEPADVAVPLLLEPSPDGDRVHFDDRLHTIIDDGGGQLRIEARNDSKELDRYAKRRRVHFVEKHCILFRRHAIERIGLFDPEQTSRAEIDTSVALWKAGCKVVLEPRARVTFSPPPPVEAAERGFFRAYWDIERNMQAHTTIRNRWNLRDVPSSMEFVRSRLALASLEPEEQLQAHRIYSERLERSVSRIQELIPAPSSFVLADEAQWKTAHLFSGRSVHPFTERNGLYWGPPASTDDALAEIDRQRQAGSEFLVLAWPAFWMLEHFDGFEAELRRRFRPIVRDDDLVAFDLRAARP